MQRAVVSYDDITLPYSPEPPRASSSNASQSKKRKWSNHNQKSDQQQAQNKNTKPPPVEEPVEDDDAEDADSRYLTSEEIWDDSALIDAWNAATEEYEAFNGPEKGWKNEPVHKSPLWYNVPPNKPPKKKLKTEPTEDAGGDAVGDSQPLDFDTFVPTYDASLALPVPEVPDYGQDYSALPPPGVGVASQDEAFSRALGAMYWGGYWTAVYHCHRSAQQVGTVGESGEAGEDQDDSGDGEDGAEVEDEDFVPTQSVSIPRNMNNQLLGIRFLCNTSIKLRHPLKQYSGILRSLYIPAKCPSKSASTSCPGRAYIFPRDVQA